MIPGGDLLHEEWRPVVGHESAYQVSSMGRVRSIPHIVNGRWGTPTRWTRAKVLNAFPKKNGYLTVGLSTGTRLSQRTVHSLVAEAFIGARPAGQEVCHGNGNPHDNRASNLRYGSRSDNARDRISHGRDAGRRKTRCPRGHLLVEPNLKRSQLKKGWRTCLSCDAVGKHASGDAEVWQRMSDAYYAQLEIRDASAA